METLILREGQYSCFIAGIDSGGVITAVFTFCEGEDGYRRPQKLPDGSWEAGIKIYCTFPASGWELPPEGEPLKGITLKGDVKFSLLEERVSQRGTQYLLAGGIALARLALAKRERALAQVIDW